MSFYDIIFYIFSLLIVASAGFCVFHPNIFYAALSLFGTFFGVAGIYVLLGADFVAASQVLIYVGGILTLILFAVMLSKNIYGISFKEERQRRIIPTILCVIVLGFLLNLVLTLDFSYTASQDSPLPTTSHLGGLLLTDYLLPFELASILLLAALIGAILLARSK